MDLDFDFCFVPCELQGINVEVDTFVESSTNFTWLFFPDNVRGGFKMLFAEDDGEEGEVWL